MLNHMRHVDKIVRLGLSVRKLPISIRISDNVMASDAHAFTWALFAMPKSAPERFVYPSRRQAARNQPVPKPTSRIVASLSLGRRSRNSCADCNTRGSSFTSAQEGLRRSARCRKLMRRYTSATKAWGSTRFSIQDSSSYYTRYSIWTIRSGQRDYRSKRAAFDAILPQLQGFNDKRSTFHANLSR
jgi:hypothetical protein